jgi:hypothetical protein
LLLLLLLLLLSCEDRFDSLGSSLVWITVIWV